MKGKKFKTYDIFLSSVLLTLNYELLELDKSNPRKVCFLFKKEKDIEQIAQDYFNDKIKVSALALFNNQKNLKNRIYSDA